MGTFNKKSIGDSRADFRQSEYFYSQNLYVDIIKSFVFVGWKLHASGVGVKIVKMIPFKGSEILKKLSRLIIAKLEYVPL